MIEDSYHERLMECGYDNEEATTKRFLRNAKDFERAFKPFYGPRAAHEFAEGIVKQFPPRSA